MRLLQLDAIELFAPPRRLSNRLGKLRQPDKRGLEIPQCPSDRVGRGEADRREKNGIGPSDLEVCVQHDHRIPDAVEHDCRIGHAWQKPADRFMAATRTAGVKGFGLASVRREVSPFG